MRHVHQPALALDLGDGLGHAQPARDLLLDEQPDHLALLGGLDLLAHDHLQGSGRGHWIRLAFSRASKAPEISLWSVTAIAPSPTSLAVASNTSTGRFAVAGVVGVHVQIHVDQPAPRQTPAQLRVSARVVPTGGQLLIDPLDLLRVRRPGDPCVQAREVVLGEATRERRGQQPLLGVWNEPTFSARE